MWAVFGYMMLANFILFIIYFVVVIVIALIIAALR